MSIKKYQRTENLWDETYPDIKTSVTYKPIYVGNGTFTMSTTAPRTSGGVANLFILSGNVSSGGSTANDGVWSGQDRTVTAIDGYVTVIYRNLDNIDPRSYETMLNTGSTALPYQPYYDWIAVPYKRYENGEWVEYNDKKYENGSWT